MPACRNGSAARFATRETRPTSRRPRNDSSPPGRPWWVGAAGRHPPTYGRSPTRSPRYPRPGVTRPRTPRRGSPHRARRCSRLPAGLGRASWWWLSGCRLPMARRCPSSSSERPRCARPARECWPSSKRHRRRPGSARWALPWWSASGWAARCCCRWKPPTATSPPCRPTCSARTRSGCGWWFAGPAACGCPVTIPALDPDHPGMSIPSGSFPCWRRSTRASTGEASPSPSGPGSSSGPSWVPPSAISPTNWTGSRRSCAPGRTSWSPT